VLETGTAVQPYIVARFDGHRSAISLSTSQAASALRFAGSVGQCGCPSAFRECVSGPPHCVGQPRRSHGFGHHFVVGRVRQVADEMDGCGVAADILLREAGDRLALLRWESCVEIGVGLEGQVVFCTKICTLWRKEISDGHCQLF